jgi:protein SCO1
MKKILSLLLVLIFSLLGFAQDKETTAAEKYFSNTELINQNRERMRLYQDILKDRVVIINAFHTSCASTIPLINRNLQKISKAFANNLGKELFIVSITVDSINDTPEKLKEYAKNYGAKPGWLFLSGEKDNVDQALKKFGLYVENIESHSTVLIMGNGRTGLWKKAYGLAKAEELIPIVESVLNDKK